MILPLIASVLSAFESNISKKILEKASVRVYTQSYFTVVLLLQLPVLLFYRIDLLFILLSALCGFLSFSANMLYLRGLRLNNVVDVAPLKVLAVLTTVILTCIFFADEKFSIRIYIIIALIILSMYLLYNTNGGFLKTISAHKSRIVIAAMLIWGVFYTVLKYSLQTYNPILMYFGTGLFFLFYGVVYNFIKKKNYSFINLKEKVNLLGREIYVGYLFFFITFVILCQYYLLYTSISVYSTTLSVVVYSLDILFTTLFSIVVFKSRIGLKKWIGVILSIVCVVMLNL